MNNINIIESNSYHHYPYINNKIAKLQQQGRSFSITTSLCYQSKGKPVNLNGKAEGFSNEPNFNIELPLENGKKLSPKIIKCRHLAERYINTDQPKSTYLSSIDSKEKLENHPDFLIDHNRLYNTKDFELAYYFSLDQLPQVIQQLIINESIAKNNQDICFLLHSSIHAMAIRIKQKVEEGVFIIYFYDPNETNIHKKIVLSNITEINKLPEQIIFTNLTLNYFKEDIPTACILGLGTAENKAKDIKIYGAVSPIMLYLMTMNEHVNEDILKKLLLNNNDDKTHNFNILNAKNNDGVPGLNLVLSLNKVDTLKTLINATMNYNLDYKDKITLLAAKDANGNTGLYNAFSINSTEAIEEFCLAILNSDLEYEDKILLLKGYNSLGVPGVAVAQANNLTASLAAFTRVIKQSNLKEEDKNMLLSIAVLTNECRVLKYNYKDSLKNYNIIH